MVEPAEPGVEVAVEVEAPVEPGMFAWLLITIACWIVTSPLFRPEVIEAEPAVEVEAPAEPGVFISSL